MSGSRLVSNGFVLPPELSLLDCFSEAEAAAAAATAAATNAAVAAGVSSASLPAFRSFNDFDVHRAIETVEEDA